MRRLCWKPRPTFCSTQSTPSKRVQPSFKTSSRSVIGPSDVCRHLSLVLCYPVMIFCITKPQYKPNCCLRFDLMTFRLIDCPSFLSSYATSVKWDSKGNSSGGFLSTEWTQIDCRNKMLYNLFFPLLSELSRFCVRHWRLLRQRSARCSRKNCFCSAQKFILVSWACGSLI